MSQRTDYQTLLYDWMHRKIKLAVITTEFREGMTAEKLYRIFQPIMGVAFGTFVSYLRDMHILGKLYAPHLGKKDTKRVWSSKVVVMEGEMELFKKFEEDTITIIRNRGLLRSLCEGWIKSIDQINEHIENRPILDFVCSLGNSSILVKLSIPKSPDKRAGLFTFT